MENEAQDGLFKLRSGVVLRLDAPSPLALKDALAQLEKDHPEPKAPVAFIEALERDEPNESDPDYQRALLLYQGETIDLIMNVLIVTGTSEDSRPPEMPGPEDDGFREYVEVIGIPLAPTLLGRYVQWVRYVAAKGKDDLQDLNRELSRLVGASEEDVRLAAESFPGLAGRSSNSSTRPGGPRRDGNRVSKRAARSRS